jgi:uncharacterized protein (TIGR04255 family)
MDDFPIPIPERMPTRINPCPILEAILEIRFVTREDWSVLPGLLYNQIRDRYPDKRNLPLSQIPEDIRRSNADLVYKPLLQFVGKRFMIQFGPRVVSLAVGRDYPGWGQIHNEMTWLLQKLAAATFIAESERLGMRYIDFFSGDVFPNLIIRTFVGDRVLSGPEMTLTKVLRKDSFTARLLLSNSAFVAAGNESLPGSVIDTDVWLGPNDFELFENGIDRFSAAHQLNKSIFFGLLKPDFLATLSPNYQ